MRRQGLVWLSAAVVALGAAACFSDPTKSLRAGATRLALAQQTLLLRTGDSASVQALVYDGQGNQLTMTGAVWSSVDATIASVRPDTANPIPGDVFARGVVKGVAAGGGVTHVVLTLGSLTDTLRVTVLPAVFQGATNVIGTAGADTIPATPSSPAAAYSAGDTLVVSSTALMTFNPNSQILFGPDAAYILARSATQIKAMARRGYQGPATITNLTFAGNAETGPIAVASINTSNVSIQRARFRGTAAAAANALFGAGTNTIVVTAAGTVTFDSLSGVILDSVPGSAFPAISLINTTVHGGTTMTLVTRASTDTTHAKITLTNLLVGGVRVDSMSLPASAAIGPVARTTLFPGTVSILGAGNLLDTIVVRGNGLGNFVGSSSVTVNGVTAFIISQTLDSLRAIAKLSGAATPTVGFRLGQTAVSLAAQGGTLTVNATTGELNEPANDSGKTAPTINIVGATSAAPAQLFGAISDAADSVDYYKITTVAGNLTVGLAFAGTGAGGSTNPKLDLRVCSDQLCATPIVAPTNATAVNPATGTSTGTTQPKSITATALTAGTYYIKVTGANTGAATFSYRLRVNQ